MSEGGVPPTQTRFRNSILRRPGVRDTRVAVDPDRFLKAKIPQNVETARSLIESSPTGLDAVTARKIEEITGRRPEQILEEQKLIK